MSVPSRRLAINFFWGRKKLLTIFALKKCPWKLVSRYSHKGKGKTFHKVKNKLLKINVALTAAINILDVES